MKNFINIYSCLLNVINQDYLIFENNPNKNLIFEEVYFRDIFDELIKYIRINMNTYLKSYLYLTNQDIKNKIPQNWNGLKYMKSNKDLY